MWERVAWSGLLLVAVLVLPCLMCWGVTEARLGDEALTTMLGGVNPSWCRPCTNCKTTSTPRCSDDTTCTKYHEYDFCPNRTQQSVFFGAEECSTRYGNQVCQREQNASWMKCWETSSCWCVWSLSSDRYVCERNKTLNAVKVMAITDHVNCQSSAPPTEWSPNPCY
jgi:hypothetical protein